MRVAFKVSANALHDLWENAFLAIFCSLVWLFLTLMIIPAPPATVAVFAIAGQIATREPLIEFSDFLKLIWRYFGLGWRWAAVYLPVAALLLVDFRTLPRIVPVEAVLPLQIIILVLLALWCVVNWFALAFLFQQEQPSLLQALRNSALLILRHPALAFLLTLITAAGLWLSLIFVIVNLLFAPMFVGLVAAHAVKNRLDAYRLERKENPVAESGSQPAVEA